MRDQIIHVRVTAEEHRKAKEIAAARRLSVSELLRGAALGSPLPTRKMDGETTQHFARALVEQARMAGKLQQLLRLVREGKIAGHEANLARSLSRIDELRDQLRELIA